MRLIERPRILRIIRKLYSMLLLVRARSLAKALTRANLTSTKSVLGSANAVVSMTTHGARISDVYLTIEAIARGSIRPKSMTLWLDDQSAFDSLPDSLKRLQKRGLEVALSRNYGPHTKYFPALLADKAQGSLLVTADDDIMYPRYWLKGLVQAARRKNSGVTCYRAHRLHLNEAGGVAPYSTWKECWSPGASFLNFPTGVSGAAYSAVFMEFVKKRGLAFLESCPRNDDLWLHKLAVENGFEIAQVLRIPLEFPVLPGSQDSGLFHENVAGGSNDVQILATYSDSDLSKLRLVARQCTNSRD